MIDFNLPKKEIAEVYVSVARCIKDKKSQIDTINSVDGEKRVVAAFLVGLITGAQSEAISPGTSERLSDFFGRIISLLEERGEEDTLLEIERWYGGEGGELQ